MTDWHVPFVNGNFIINIERQAFVRAPDGNTLTVAQVIAQNVANAPVIPPDREVTTDELLEELAKEKGVRIRSVAPSDRT